ncbi:hypothetical protein BEH_07255 [Priestia filamentosa]|uniref:Uncharacterized protein n=1 Tax=Priestia filamentosa TaxID=1402861 RepID=A0A0H4KGI4_9BACI|nr:hypothetical protein [Priestia filamentosa]AKO91916.1 hypothetical protein BEH_07255 [Priestia filamentosa]
MTTRHMKALTEVGNHEIGNLNSLKVKTVAHGAIVVGADVDNFTLVELGYNAEGERTCKQLSDVAKKSYLIATPEDRYLGEQLVDFYNGVGDRARIVVLEAAYTRFDSSAFVLDATAPKVTNGQKAHWDVAAKKFRIHDGSHVDYATASAKFEVVSNEDDLEYTNGKEQVRFEVIEA